MKWFSFVEVESLTPVGWYVLLKFGNRPARSDCETSQSTLILRRFLRYEEITNGIAPRVLTSVFASLDEPGSAFRGRVTEEYAAEMFASAKNG
jgi:hypothetical protein